MLLCAATHFSKLRRAGKWVVLFCFFPELWRDVETMMWAFTSRASGAALLLGPAGVAPAVRYLCCVPCFGLLRRLCFLLLSLAVVNVAAVLAL